MKYDRATFMRAPQRDLEALYLRAKNAYYNSDREVMSDAAFDVLERVIQERFPRSRVLKVVGPATLPAKVEKVTLPAWLGSLDKVRADGSLREFVTRHPGPYTLSDKIDGVSVLHEVKGGVERLYSRGKGRTGFDVSALLGHVRGIGRAAEGQLTRGELVIPMAAFTPHAGSYENPRAMMSGILNRAAKSRAAAPTATSAVFYAHQQVRPAAPLATSGARLKGAGWKVVPFAVLKTANPDTIEGILTRHLAARKAKSRVEMDGIVVTAGDGVTMAFKGADDVAEVEVDRVVWEPSRYGMLNPKIVLKTGVRLAGVTVRQATAHNAKMVLDGRLGPGAIIRIVRAGEVIPKIVGVVKGARAAQFPPRDAWEWNKSGVDIMAKRGDAAVDAMVKTKRLVAFVHELGVEGAKGGLVSRLVADGIDNPLRLLNASAARLQAAGLGPTQSANLVRDLDAALDRATHVDMMYASGLFARGWGRSRFTAVLNEMSYADLVAAAALDPVPFYERLAVVPGLESTLIAQLHRGVRAYARWIVRMGWTPRAAAPRRARTVRGPLTGKNVVFTKVRDPDSLARIVRLGGVMGPRVNDDTAFVVVPSMQDTSEKVRAAIARNIRRVPIDDLDAVLTALEAQR